jgi:hypothetical protein
LAENKGAEESVEELAIHEASTQLGDRHIAVGAATSHGHGHRPKVQQPPSNAAIESNPYSTPIFLPYFPFFLIFLAAI